jgi:hypothetical protein
MPIVSYVHLSVMTPVMFMDALKYSSMNYKNRNGIKCDFILFSFSMAYQPLKMATHPLVAATLN